MNRVGSDRRQLLGLLGVSVLAVAAMSVILLATQEDSSTLAKDMRMVAWVMFGIWGAFGLVATWRLLRRVPMPPAPLAAQKNSATKERSAPGPARAPRNAPSPVSGSTAAVAPAPDPGLVAGSDDDSLGAILDSQPAFETLEELSFEAYQAIVQALPAPEPRQIDAFAEFVARAKSWYKHLPDAPDSCTLYVFLDPHAGMDRLLDARGRARFTPRVEGSYRFHHTWMFTAQYRERFGFLNFSCEAGSVLYTTATLENPTATGGQETFVLDTNWTHPVIWTDDGRPKKLPDPVLQAGAVEVDRALYGTDSRQSGTDGLAPRRQQQIARLRQAAHNLRDLLLGGPGTTTPLMPKGDLAVFEDRGQFQLVRVNAIADPAGLHAELTDLGTGERHALRNPWELVEMSGQSWSARDGSWAVMFDATLVAAALRAHRVLADEIEQAIAIGMLVQASEAIAQDEPAPVRVPHRRPPKVAGEDPLAKLEIAASNALFNQGRLLRESAGTPEVAELLLRASLAARHRLYGDHQLCAVNRNDLGLVMRDQGDDDQTVVLFGDANGYFSDHHGNDHPDLATTLHNHGATLLRLRRLDEGQAALERSLALQRKHGRTSPVDISNTLWLLSSAAQQRALTSEAISLLEQALEVRRDAGLGNTIEASEIATELAGELLGEGQLQEAASYYQFSAEVLAQRLGPGHRRAKDALEQAVDVLQQLGRSSEARSLEKKLNRRTS